MRTRITIRQTRRLTVRAAVPQPHIEAAPMVDITPGPPPSRLRQWVVAVRKRMLFRHNSEVGNG